MNGKVKEIGNVKIIHLFFETATALSAALSIVLVGSDVCACGQKEHLGGRIMLTLEAICFFHFLCVTF